MVDITRRATARDQPPRGDTWHTWDGAPAVHTGHQVAGTREVITHHPPRESELTKHLVNWAAQTWEGHKTQAQLILCLWGVPENLNLSGLDLGSAHNPGPVLDSSPESNLEPEQGRPGKHTRHERGQIQCGPDTVSTPHTCQWYLFAVFLPPYSTTEQVSLSKLPPLPLVSGQKLDTEGLANRGSQNKQEEGTNLDVTGATD